MGTTKDEQMGAYTEAVKSGLYAKKTGLVGKYDNVRRYWEDEITRIFLRPYLQKIIERSQQKMMRLRIMDLGCGSADGYELLNAVRQRNPDLEEIEVTLLSSNVLGHYKGVDLNEDLLNQARGIYGDNPKMEFVKGDFTKGLPMGDDEKPYDLYFTSYGACSHHNEDETLINILAEIAGRVEDYCVIVCDWLGRYAYEWQTLWTNDLNENRNMDYVVSYIYDKEERELCKDELLHLNLRLMSRQEAESIVAEAGKRAGTDIKPLIFFDRSVLTGRHMDTCEYNPYSQPIRQAVNSLHEINMRTDLSTLMIDYVPKPGFEFLNDYFEHMQLCWNTLVRYVWTLLESFDEEKRVFANELPRILPSYPPVLRRLMESMKLVVEGVGWLTDGLPRENMIEPQLGYALRNLIKELQNGQGAAHSMVGIFEVDKR